ncbi:MULTISPECIES: hypothetical protein [unclassified Brevundimonas]|uniref:hypothetical protein n=1 Tax=unclassified Brevundimonas TaxID=2622653 RepID=UPI000CFDE5F0|nr:MULTISPECIES: hypothetical protein [unclassified Brevundimonas]PRA27647.1 hypothetical protein CQ024_11200 [Brevundimonas sp. MYb27]PQZ74988.1 hypothetical protein CQ026_15295 [Brevundimonas sp. MYb31]PRB17635.1 hypothetical protein CQ039_00935 [Brevundimonas sp. MYb52]PRB38006.1 hypothetical protein CQ035_00935 [Brevundimonas sp. MYb46]PRB45363.1 hypothetical protein CQ028_13050 [Brevundimonas sp. MYb33]
MGDVVQFRGRRLEANRAGRVPITVWVIDDHQPERTRWSAQLEITYAAGFRALKGFTDKKARRGGRHRFSCSPDRLNDFIWAVEPLIEAERIGVEVSGKRVRARLRRKRA